MVICVLMCFLLVFEGSEDFVVFIPMQANRGLTARNQHPREKLQ